MGKSSTLIEVQTKNKGKESQEKIDNEKIYQDIDNNNT